MRPGGQGFRRCPIGFFHIDIAEVQTAQGKLCLFVAIDRTSKFAFVQLVESATRVTASAFLEALIAAVPYRIHMRGGGGGWAKTVAGLRKARHRGLSKIDWQFTLAMAAYNLVRLPKLLETPA
jgi:hypothetical protein